MNRNTMTNRQYRGMQSKRAGGALREPHNGELHLVPRARTCLHRQDTRADEAAPTAEYVWAVPRLLHKGGTTGLSRNARRWSSVVFEAKHTDDDRIKYDRLTGDQIEDLEMHHRLGAVAFVLVSFGLQGYYRIPWEVWRDMKQIYGRKYITREEAERYSVPFVSGVIRIMEYVYKAEEILNWDADHNNVCVACGGLSVGGTKMCIECRQKRGLL